MSRKLLIAICVSGIVVVGCSQKAGPGIDSSISADPTLVDAIEEQAKTTRRSPVSGAVAESWIPDPEGNRVDVTEECWPI